MVFIHLKLWFIRICGHRGSEDRAGEREKEEGVADRVKAVDEVAVLLRGVRRCGLSRRIQRI